MANQTESRGPDGVALDDSTPNGGHHVVMCQNGGMSGRFIAGEPIRKGDALENREGILYRYNSGRTRDGKLNLRECDMSEQTCPRCTYVGTWKDDTAGFCCPHCLMEWELPQTRVLDTELAALMDAAEQILSKYKDFHEAVISEWGPTKSDKDDMALGSAVESALAAIKARIGD